MKEVIDFLRSNITPLEDSIYGLGYRASAYLKDGTYLPCVIFRNSKPLVDLAVKRFDDERKGKSIFSKKSNMGYRDIVQTFVASGNKVNDYDIEKVELSPFAFPIEILKQIQGETTMGWTGFVLKMDDGKNFAFGTQYLMEFFQMPGGYSASNIKEVINHSYLTKSGEVESHNVPFIETPEDYDSDAIYRERQFFICNVDEL